MNDIAIILLLLGVGAALLVAELFLPAHGVIGIAGVVAILVGIGRTFLLNEWAGVVLALATACSIPFVWSAVIKIWPKTFLGRQLLLGPVVNVPKPPEVFIGQTGVAISELRPMGVCDFSGRRVEVITEIGTIEPGTAVTVTAIHDRRPTVRKIQG